MKAIFVLVWVAVCVYAANVWEQSGIYTERGPGKLGQINGYSCGPHSLMQCLRKITGIEVPEKTLAVWSRTTPQGTTEANLSQGLKVFNTKYNKHLTMKWEYFSSFTERSLGETMANPKSCVFFLMIYENRVGHYELPYRITEGSKNLTVANSLGEHKGEGYMGYIESRSWKDEKAWINALPRQSVCVVSDN